MVTKNTPSKSPQPGLTLRVNASQTQTPVSFFADQVGEINVTPFTSRLVFTNSHAGVNLPQIPVVSVSIPTIALLNLAGTIFTILSKEETNTACKTQFEGFLSALDDLKARAGNQETK